MKSIRDVVLLLVIVLLLPSPLEAGRYYMSNVARWISPDPAVERNLPANLLKAETGILLLTTSPLSYSFNNPLRYVDPDGQWPTTIHNRILNKALSDLLTRDQIGVLEQASRRVDDNQSAGGSFKHAMRSPGQSAGDAEQQMKEFVDTKRGEFINGTGEEGLAALGEALHPVMDATSPAHEGFQEWEGLESAEGLFEGVIHVLKERNISNEKMKEVVKMVREFYLSALKEKQAQEAKNNEQE